MIVEVLEDKPITRAWRKGDVCEVIESTESTVKVQIPTNRKFQGKGLSSIVTIPSEHVREIDEDW